MTLRERLRGLGVHPFLIALGLAAVAMLVFALPQGGAQSTIDELYLCSADGHTAGILIGQEGVVDAISTERQTLQAASGTQTGTLWGMYLSASNVEVEDVINDPLDCTLKLRFLLDGRPATGFYRCDGRLEHRPNTYAVRIWLNKTMPSPDAGKCEPGKPVGGDSGHGVENAIPLMTGGAPPSPQPVQPQPQPEPEQEPEAEDQIDDEDDSEDQDTPNEDDDESQDEASPADDDEHPQSDPETTDERDNEQVDGSADESDTEESAVTDTQPQESEGDSSDATPDSQDGQNGQDEGDTGDTGDVGDARDAAGLELEEDGPATDDGTGIERTDQVLVQKPPGTGLGGSDAETTSRSSRVTWAIIVLLVAVAAIALDWARRRGDTRK